MGWKDEGVNWAPTGWNQTQDRVANAPDNWKAYAERTSPDWSTGGQTGSTQNAFQSSAFFQDANATQERAKKEKVNPTDLDDFTGIVTYSGKGKHIGDFQAGDVFI